MSVHQKSASCVDTTPSPTDKGKKRKGSDNDEPLPRKTKKMKLSSQVKISDSYKTGTSSTTSSASNKGKTPEQSPSKLSSKVSTSPATKGKITETKSLMEEEKFEFFFGKQSPFSQHHPAKFMLNDVTYNCAEQYMMHQKAVLFKDENMAKQILATDNPVQQKKLGRKVQPFDKDRWAKRSLDVVKEASVAKFSQNPDLLQKLLSTHPRTLVEAAPRDRLWGIGLGASNPKARDPKQWRGRNLLGKILTQVREELSSQTDEKNESE